MNFPSRISLFACLPNMCLNLSARKSPVPGLFTQIFFFDNFSFLLIFFKDTIDEKANFAVFFSIFEIFLCFPFEFLF